MNKNGMVNHGAQLIHAVSGSEVPHITLIVGNSYGAGNYAMCGRSFDPRFLLHIQMLNLELWVLSN